MPCSVPEGLCSLVVVARLDAFPAVPGKLLLIQEKQCLPAEGKVTEVLTGLQVEILACKTFTQSDSSLAQVVFQKLWLLAAGVGYLPRNTPEEDSSLDM